MMVGLAFLAAAALAAQDAPLGWVCARNFALGDYHGFVEQSWEASGALYPIRFALWDPRHDVRLEWQHDRMARPDPGPPDSLEWEVRLVVRGDQGLWLRLWADGLYAGQTRYAVPEAARRMRDLQGHRLRLDSDHERAILERLMRAESWEGEIVGDDGVSLLREPIPRPAQAAIRAAHAAQSAWLATAVGRGRSPNCHPIEPESDQSWPIAHPRLPAPTPR